MPNEKPKLETAVYVAKELAKACTDSNGCPLSERGFLCPLKVECAKVTEETWLEIFRQAPPLVGQLN